MKIICKIMIIAFIIISIYSIGYITNARDLTIWEQASKFLDEGASTITLQISELWGAGGDAMAKNGMTEIIDFLWGIGILVVFGSTIVLGIKYMLVSPNEKSRIKQATTPYIIGVVIILGALTIWKLIIDVLDGAL